MCDLKVCRICLRMDLKYYKYDEFNLQYYYEEMMNRTMNTKDGLPLFFCFECAMLLHKFHKFREKCYNVRNVLQDMLTNGPITYADIYDVNIKRLLKTKHDNLEILTASDRVRTYNFQYTKNKDTTVTVPDDFKEEIVDVHYSEGAYSDGDDHESNDPVHDPVAGERKDISEIKTKQNDCVDELLVEYKCVESKLKFEPDKSDKEPESNIDDKSTVLDPANKKKIGKRKKIKTRQTKRYGKTKKHNKTEDIDSDSSEEVLSKIRQRKGPRVLPDTKKTHKFDKPKSGLKNLAFLDSGFWRKSSLSDEEALKEFQAKAQDRKYLSAAYKCTDCYKGFSQKNMLDRHIPLRHGEAVGKLVCRFCRMRFKSKYFLDKHMRQHYTKYECLRCDLVCTLENSALFHEEYHNGVVRKCMHCDKEFKHLSTFYTHLRTHRSKHICSLCGESFVSELGLRLHRKLKHVHDTNQPMEKIEENTYCDICKIKFETKEAYDKHWAHSALHIDENKSLDDDQVANLFDEKEDEDTENKAEELLKRKSRVEKTLSAARKSHLARKIAKRPTTCHQCGKYYETQSACMKHHIAEHPGTSFFSPKERIICEICGASLAPGSVASHLNQHTRRKMYTCDVCGRSFTTSTMLRTHMVTHTGEKRFACNLCDKRFTQNGSLSLHYRTFHLKQPYPKRNRRKKIDKPNIEGFSGKEE